MSSNLIFAALTAVLLGGAFTLTSAAQTPGQLQSAVNVGTASATLPPARKIKAIDADNHNLLLNRPGMISLILGTNEDSQDAARAAGEAVYPLRGRRDFQLIVVVDLRHTMAAWVPAVVLSKMRSNLDEEAIELKPYYLKNGNKSNPRNTSYVIAEFSGTICPQLGWPDNSDDLRAILFGADGRELTRWDKVSDMDKLHDDVRAAIEDLVKANQAKAAAAAAKPQGTKLVQPPAPPPPLPPPKGKIPPKPN